MGTFFYTDEMSINFFKHIIPKLIKTSLCEFLNVQEFFISFSQ